MGQSNGSRKMKVTSHAWEIPQVSNRIEDVDRKLASEVYCLTSSIRLIWRRISVHPHFGQSTTSHSHHSPAFHPSKAWTFFCRNLFSRFIITDPVMFMEIHGVHQGFTGLVLYLIIAQQVQLPTQEEPSSASSLHAVELRILPTTLMFC